MPFATSVVPMPHWSTPLGCTKLFLTIVVLAFIAACTAIWGWYPAFSITIFSATLSLLAFGYYMIALSFKPTLYNKWLVLSLETVLTLQWFVSLVLLAGWTGASSAIPRLYYNLSPYPTPYGIPYDAASNLSRRTLDRGDLLFHSWEPFRSWKRQDPDVSGTLASMHGVDAHYTAQILAGISAGLAGMIFIMYAVTLATFTMNFHSDSDADTSGRPDLPPRSALPHDEEMQLQPRPHHTNTNTTSTPTPIHAPKATQISPATTPLSLSEPLEVDPLPKDFEPKPQTQEYYLSPEEATKAGTQPPTPVMRALSIGDEEQESRGKGEREMKVEGTTEAVVASSGRGKTGTVTRDDGRVEREV